jgi:hypothetical protein
LDDPPPAVPEPEFKAEKDEGGSKEDTGNTCLFRLAGDLLVQAAVDLPERRVVDGFEIRPDGLLGNRCEGCLVNRTISAFIPSHSQFNF